MIWNPEFTSLPKDKQVSNSLKEVKIVHNSALLVELKDEHDIEDDLIIAEGKQGYTPTVFLVDDTESERTVIVNYEDDKKSFKHLQINIEWTLGKLIEFLVAEFQKEGPHRLKNHFDNKNFFLEEMDSKLKNYETFREGGTRIQLESGRPTTMAEISINVLVHRKEDDQRQFYFSADLTVQNVKELLIADFFPEGSVDPAKYTLFKVDAFDEPTNPLRRLKQPLKKSNVTTGELLILKSEKDISSAEKLKLSLHFTSSGLSEDSKYLEDIDICKDFTLNDLKQIIMDLPSLAKMVGADGVKTEAHLRIREKTFSGFFGRIFRESNKTLKQINVKDHSSLVVQILAEPECLENNTFILFYARRDIISKTYSQFQEVKFAGTRIRDLKSKAREIYCLDEDLKVELAKHVPHQFMW